MRGFLFKAAILPLVLLTGQHARSQVTEPALPLDPIATIVDAFRTHPIVTLGEGSHGNEQSHAFRLVLLRDPRFGKVVNDIVVEFGSSRYQDVMDRFVSGADVPYSELRKVWEDTASPGTVWDRPIYEEFFRAVREVNSKRPKSKSLRVLLGDMPVDWSSINSWADYSKIGRNDKFPAELIQREVLSKRRKAIVIYADAHFVRQNMYFPLKDSKLADERFARPNGSLVTLLESAGVRVFSIRTLVGVDLTALQPNMASWTPPKIALIRGTTLGHANSSAYYGNSFNWVLVDREKGIEEKTRADPERSPLLQDQFDAVLYVGPQDGMTSSEMSKSLCSDAEYMKMRFGRLQISSPQETDPGAGLKKYCTTLPASAQ